MAKIWSKSVSISFIQLRVKFILYILQGDMEVDDVWDDTELIKMYDESLQEISVS